MRTLIIFSCKKVNMCPQVSLIKYQKNIWSHSWKQGCSPFCKETVLSWTIKCRCSLIFSKKIVLNWRKSYYFWFNSSIANSRYLMLCSYINHVHEAAVQRSYNAIIQFSIKTFSHEFLLWVFLFFFFKNLRAQEESQTTKKKLWKKNRWLLWTPRWTAVTYALQFFCSHAFIFRITC